MTWIPELRKRPLWVLGALIAVGLCLDSVTARPVNAGFVAILGAQSWGPWHTPSQQEPRISVLEADAWEHSLRDGTLRPVPQLPLPQSFWRSVWNGMRRTPASSSLMPQAYFTPAAYLAQIETLRSAYCRQKDILMYYGGVRYRPAPEGLNFNAWSGQDLKKLRVLGSRPFIGLETMDHGAVRFLMYRLKEAGYGRLDRIYVRIASEPSFSPYGTEDGTRTGRRRTPQAYQAYREKFIRTSAWINSLNRRLGLNVHTVYAGASREDFDHYAPPADAFDAIGYDLYVTPENKPESLKQLKEITRRYPSKPLVIPEFGIATERHNRVFFQPRTRWSNPAWAADALGDVLMLLGRHPGGVGEITVFSVNVSGRRSDRRWSWAWTPQMYEMLKEWQSAPGAWQKQGFHRYDPPSYPVGRSVMFINRPDVRVIYRKLTSRHVSGAPLFQEVVFFPHQGAPQNRVIYFDAGEKREVRTRQTY